jgi:hypothetical protein
VGRGEDGRVALGWVQGRFGSMQIVFGMCVVDGGLKLLLRDLKIFLGGDYMTIT